MSEPLSILVLTDGKPGHQNQSLGLAEAISRLTPAVTERHQIERKRFAPLRSVKPDLPNPPQLILGAGHATHAPMLQLARRTSASCVVLMKPSLPAALFDLCLVPEHDYGSRNAPPNVVLTKGAINRVPPPGEQERRGGLILLGGPSSTHGWDSDDIRRRVTTIVESCGNRPWRVTDSRRSPSGDLSELSAACPALVPFPHDDTGPEWLPQRLAEAAEVWVSEDSVSMIYESLSSGANVGLLPVPRKKKTSRIIRGVEALVADRWVTRFDDWKPGTDLAAPPAVLRESDRCARVVLDQLFPHLLS